ncbi:MAG: DUF3822 family protein [Chitinophagaceae bacterium]|nr:DUF3822 family protein [Chitinophagaceae bacterium]
MSFHKHVFIDNTSIYKSKKNDLTLCICLGKNYIQYLFYQICTKKIYYLCSLLSEKSIVNNEQIEPILNHQLLKYCDKVYIVYDQIKNTLVPLPIYSKQHQSLYFQHTHDIENDEHLLTQIPRENMVELFAIKKTSEKYFKETFPNTHFLSLSACLLNSYFELVKNQFHTIYTLFLNCTENTLYLTLFKYKELHYHFCFELESAEDALYHLLNLLHTKNVKISEANFILSGFCSYQNEIADLLQTYFSIQTFNQNMISDELINEKEDFPIHILFNLYSILRCVS